MCFVVVSFLQKTRSCYLPFLYFIISPMIKKMIDIPIKVGARKFDTKIKEQMLSFVCSKELFAAKPIARIKSIIPIHPVILARVRNILYGCKSFLPPRSYM